MFLDLKILTSVLGCIVYLYYTQVDIKDRTVSLETVVYNVTLEDAYDFMINPDGFERWFHWIPRAYQADHRRIDVGKKYIIHFISTPIVFEIRDLSIREDRINYSLESKAILKPNFNVLIYRTCKYLKYPRLKLKISLSFNRESYLFRYPVGIFLQNVTRLRMIEALTNLENVFLRIHRNVNRIL